MKDKPYLSQTQLTMYERCGEQYRRRYIEKEKIPPGIGLVKGTGVHGGSKANFRQKIETRKDLPKKEIIDISVANFDKKLNKEGISLTREEETTGYKKVVGQARDAVVVLSALYSDCVAPKYQPQFVEEKQLLEVPEASHNLLIMLDVADIEGIIADVKTSKKKINQQAIDEDEQLTFYSLVYTAKTGKLPKAVRLERLIEKKIPEYQMLESMRTMKDLRVIVNRINVMLNGLKKGSFIPCQSTAWWCDERYCGYAMTCPYYPGRK